MFKIICIFIVSVINAADISVIIPTYNASGFIEKSIESVQSQTFKDIEIIIVDDKSKDNTIEIVKKIQLNDDRIKIIILEKNSGAAGAPRNVGMDQSKSKYLYFFDSDDFIEKTALERLFNKAEKTNADIVIGFSRSIKFDSMEEFMNFKPISKYKDILRINCKELNVKKCTQLFENASVCNKLHRRSFIENNNIRFLEGVVCEDQAFSFSIYMMDPKIEQIPGDLYFYTQRPKAKNIQRSVVQSYLSSNDKIKNLIYIAEYNESLMKEKKLLDYGEGLLKRNYNSIAFRLFRKALLSDFKSIKELFYIANNYFNNSPLYKEKYLKSLSEISQKLIPIFRDGSFWKFYLMCNYYKIFKRKFVKSAMKSAS